MALGRSSSSTITWPTAQSSVVLDSDTSDTATSEEQAIAATAWEASVQVKADNAVAPGAGDTVEVYVLYSFDNSQYDTSGHGDLLGVLNLETEDGATNTWPVLTSPSHLKLYVKSNAGTDAVTVTAEYVERTG